MKTKNGGYGQMLQISDLKIVALAVMITIGFYVIDAQPKHAGDTYPAIAAAPVVDVSKLSG